MDRDNKGPWGLFERYGIELEYMICDQKTLNVLPIADQLMYTIAGSYCNEWNAGPISYSNELALHVFELKTSVPVSDLAAAARDFQEHVQKINAILSECGALLLPTGMHPWMDPFKELRLWSHGQNTVYEAYHRIFDCRGHGWANLQSAHINLPFSNDEELKALHSAIRWLLPIIPALSASSPIADGKPTGFLDTRLETYRHNQKAVPSITGQVVPEPVASTDEYYEKILRPMWKDISPHDPDGILQEEWLNSRGSIVRFDRSAIEIRILDTQECPAMDIAATQAIVGVLRELAAKVMRGEIPYDLISTEELAVLLHRTVRHGDDALIDHPQYLGLFGLSRPMSAAGLWHELAFPKADAGVCRLLQRGLLAKRILKGMGGNLGRDAQFPIYRALSRCLQSGAVF
jgi:glutamate---cysteine ligase / carboxylate-amine ligase